MGDWIDREVGDLSPLWPAEAARAAIARAHELGCRVTAHVFGEQALAELVEAGIDGIEHGTGLTDETIAVDGRASGRAGPHHAAAGELRDVRPRPARPSSPRTPGTCGPCTPAGIERFGQAREAGVPIYAGTDAGGYLPHGLVGQEIAALAEFSSPAYALGAGSWRARAWLGRPDRLVEGAPADLVAFDRDPRDDLGGAAPSAVDPAPRKRDLKGICS